MLYDSYARRGETFALRLLLKSVRRGGVGV